VRPSFVFFARISNGLQQGLRIVAPANEHITERGQPEMAEMAERATHIVNVVQPGYNSDNQIPSVHESALLVALCWYVAR
jgi:hypothetical protein